VRSLRGSPGFAAIACLTLALGIGATTAIFSIVDAVLLRPLPYESPHELVWVDEVRARGGTMAVAWPNFVDWRELSHGLRGLAAYSSHNPTILGRVEPVRIPGTIVSEDFWKVLAVTPIAGRLTLPEDHRVGAAPVVVVSRALVRDVLGSSEATDAVGRFVQIQGSPFEIVGVGGFRCLTMYFSTVDFVISRPSLQQFPENRRRTPSRIGRRHSHLRGSQIAS